MKINIPKVYLEMGSSDPSSTERPLVYRATGDDGSPAMVIGSVHRPAEAIIADVCDAYNARQNAEAQS